MVGNPRARNNDVPSVAQEGVSPDPSFFPDWTNEWGAGTRRDWNDPFKGIPLPGSRRPPAPSWLEDPSYPGLPPSLRYPLPENPGFPPVPPAKPNEMPVPESQRHEWLLSHLLQTIRSMEDDSAQQPFRSPLSSRAGRSSNASSSSDPRLSSNGAYLTAGLRGLASGLPMELRPVQPPIFFPFG